MNWESGVLRWRKATFCKPHCLPISMRDAVRNFLKLLQVGKVGKPRPMPNWARKPPVSDRQERPIPGRLARPPVPKNLGRLARPPVLKNLGRLARPPVPISSGIMRRAVISQTGSPRGIGNGHRYLARKKSTASRTTRSMTIALSWSRVRCQHSGRFTLSRRKTRSCKHSENTSEKNLRPAKSGGPNLRPARQLSLFQSPMVACDYA
jgi:hypothetical protein